MVSALWNSGFSASLSSPPTFVDTHAISSSTHGAAFIFYPFTTDAITHVFLNFSSRAGTPPSYRIAIEGVDSSGNPDNTVKGGGSPASTTITPPADSSWNGTGQWIALDHSFSPANKTTPLAITIRYSSGTIDASNASTIGINVLGFPGGTQLPYTNKLTSGSWSKVRAASLFGYKTATELFGLPVKNAYTTTISTSGHIQALKFTPEITAQILGISIAVQRHGSTGGSYKIGVWNSSGTEIESTGVLASNVAAGVTNTGAIVGVFPNSVELTAGTTYYFGIKNESSQLAGIGGLMFQNSDDRECIAFGLDKSLATWNGSAWADDTTVVPIVDLILNSFHAGGSSRPYHPLLSPAVIG